MRVGIIGSRRLHVDISKYIPKKIDEIVSGGAIGIDQLAEKYADEHNIPKLILRPDFKKYGKIAPLIRNKCLVDVCDEIIAIWDGKSSGTAFTIAFANKLHKPVHVYIVKSPKQESAKKDTSKQK